MIHQEKQKLCTYRHTARYAGVRVDQPGHFVQIFGRFVRCIKVDDARIITHHGRSCRPWRRSILVLRWVSGVFNRFDMRPVCMRSELALPAAWYGKILKVNQGSGLWQGIGSHVGSRRGDPDQCYWLSSFTLRLPRSAAPNGYGMKSTKEEETRAVSGSRPARSGGGEPIFTWKRRPARGRELLLDDSHCFS